MYKNENCNLYKENAKSFMVNLVVNLVSLLILCLKINTPSTICAFEFTCTVSGLRVGAYSKVGG